MKDKKPYCHRRYIKKKKNKKLPTVSVVSLPRGRQNENLRTPTLFKTRILMTENSNNNNAPRDNKDKQFR